MLIGILAITVFVVLVAAIFINTSPEFGGKPTGNDLERIENSPNYNGDGTFKNQEITLATTGVKWGSFFKIFTNNNPSIFLRDLLVLPELLEALLLLAPPVVLVLVLVEEVVHELIVNPSSKE